MEERLPDRLPARFSDVVQYGVSNLYVPQLHLVLELDGRLSVGRTRRALRLCLDREPVLGCRYVPAWGRPYWLRLGPGALDRAELLREKGDGYGGRTAGEEARQAFLAEALGGDEGPQVRALLIHGDSTDSLIVKINHQTMDAGGTKELGYLLADLYRRLDEDPGLVTAANRGSRSLRQVYGRFPRRRQLGILMSYPREMARVAVPALSLRFPSGAQRRGDYRFSIRRFARERAGAIASYGRARAATLNDIFVAAIFRALAEQSAWDGRSTLRMICTVDLRRYLPGRRAEALCNLSGFFVPNLGRDLGRDLDETLLRVKRDIDECKRGYLGLPALMGEWAASRPWPNAAHRWLQRTMVRKLAASSNVGMALTNLGPIDARALDFGTPGVRMAEILVPPFCPPFLCLGLSGFGGTLTLSAGFYPSAVPVERLERFLERIDEILPGPPSASAGGSSSGCADPAAPAG